MNVMTTSRRLAATGAAAALAAAALVGVSTTAANAAPATNTYTCELPGLVGPWDITLDSDVPGIDGVPALPAGFLVTPDLLPGGVTNAFTIPAEAHQTLGDFGVENIAFPDFAGLFGASSIGVVGMAARVSEMTANEDGTYSFDSDGTVAAFEVPAAGTYEVTPPATFSLVASTASFGDQTVPCALAGGTTNDAYHTIQVFKNASTTSGKPVAKTLKTSKVAKMKVTVQAPNETPGGKVLVKEGKKTLGKANLNNKGKATIKMGKLKKGKHNVKVVYKGDGYTEKSASEKVTFKVTR